MWRRERPPTSLFDVVYVRLCASCTYYGSTQDSTSFSVQIPKNALVILLPTVWAQVWLGSDPPDEQVRSDKKKKKKARGSGDSLCFFYRPDLHHSQRPGSAYGSTKACQAESPLSACRLPCTRKRGGRRASYECECEFELAK